MHEHNVTVAGVHVPSLLAPTPLSSFYLARPCVHVSFLCVGGQRVLFVFFDIERELCDSVVQSRVSHAFALPLRFRVSGHVSESTRWTHCWPLQTPVMPPVSARRAMPTVIERVFSLAGNCGPY